MKATLKIEAEGFSEEVEAFCPGSGPSSRAAVVNNITQQMTHAMAKLAARIEFELNLDSEDEGTRDTVPPAPSLIEPSTPMPRPGEPEPE